MKVNVKESFQTRGPLFLDDWNGEPFRYEEKDGSYLEYQNPFQYEIAIVHEDGKTVDKLCVEIMDKYCFFVSTYRLIWIEEDQQNDVIERSFDDLPSFIQVFLYKDQPPQTTLRWHCMDQLSREVGPARQEFVGSVLSEESWVRNGKYVRGRNYATYKENGEILYVAKVGTHVPEGCEQWYLEGKPSCFDKKSNELFLAQKKGNDYTCFHNLQFDEVLKRLQPRDF